MSEWRLWAGTHLVLSCIFLALTLWRGPAPERILAGTLLSSAILLWMLKILRLFDHVAGGEFVFLAASIVVGANILAVALYANRIYPIFVGAAQLVIVLTCCWVWHIGQPMHLAHMPMLLLGFDLQLVACTIGLANHVRRERNLQTSYPAWTTKVS